MFRHHSRSILCSFFAALSLAFVATLSTSAAYAHHGYSSYHYHSGRSYSEGYAPTGGNPGGRSSHYGGGYGGYGGYYGGGGAFVTQRFSGPAYIGPSGYSNYVQNYSFASTPVAQPAPMVELYAKAGVLQAR